MTSEKITRKRMKYPYYELQKDTADHKKGTVFHYQCGKLFRSAKEKAYLRADYDESEWREMFKPVILSKDDF